MKIRLTLLVCLLLVLSAKAQDEMVWIHIELIDGRTGSPMPVDVGHAASKPIDMIRL